MAAGPLFPGTAMPDSDWWHALWPDPRAVLLELGIAPSMSIVDLCCGDGYFTAPLARLASHGRVIGIDFDAELLEQARAACRGAGNCTFIEGDARNLRALVTVPVDYVLIANTFHGVPDQSGLARAVRAVLDPRGRFGVVNWHALPREQTTVLGKPRGPQTAMRMAPQAVRAVVEPAGFTVERMVDLPPYHYGIVFQREPQEARDGRVPAARES